MIVTFKFWDEDDYEEEIFSILARVWNIISLAGKRDRFNYKLFLISFLGENEYFKRLNDLESQMYVKFQELRVDVCTFTLIFISYYK